MSDTCGTQGPTLLDAAALADIVGGARKATAQPTVVCNPNHIPPYEVETQQTEGTGLPETQG